MAYGTSAYGASGYGGGANAVNEQVFFPLLGVSLAPDVLHERTAFFNGPERWYEILIRQGSENPSGPNGAEYKIYSARFPEDTPQLQVIIGGMGQVIIGAAHVITVTALVDSAIWVSGLNFSIVGRPYTQ